MIHVEDGTTKPTILHDA
jgi:hypothetical protein